MRTVVCLLFLALVGCHRWPATLKAPLVVPQGEAGKAETAAQTEQQRQQAASWSQVAASVAVVLELNGLMPSTNLTVGVNSEAHIIQALAGQAKPEDVAAAAQRKAVVLAGDLAKIRAQYATAQTEAEKQAAAKAAAEMALVQAQQAAATERQQAAQQWQAQFNELTTKANEAGKRAEALQEANAKLSKQVDEAQNQVMRDQVAWLNKGGASLAALALVGFGLATFFGGLAALRSAAPFLALCFVGALGCFGLAQIVGQWWFKWAVLGLLGAIGGVITWWVVKHYQLGTLKADTEAKFATARSVLRQTVPTLDAAYNAANAEVKAFMDEHIFQKLNSRMDAADKAAVHAVRVEIEGEKP